uniref:ATP synthase F0 subunit 8 n=1 Tax=Rhyacophila quadrifida TaxID=2904903 RepID=A0A9E8LPC7_9NEOP|nr:ATP synthase F0 subunit 8 [Rhyacophila quadrifida]UZZ44367.1 ATP synthase F0 subunit 8 [Rhyacophila quadrifida]
MPQMMPMNWIFLFFMTCLIFMVFNMMNYFNFNPLLINKYQNMTDKKNMTQSINWNW